VQGTILILDGVATTRIMLKVQLSAAWYHVVQADRLSGILQLVRKVRPDLIITSLSLPDGDARRLPQLLRPDPLLAAIPILAIVGQNDRAARLRALEAGMDEALCEPLDDRLLQARIRGLIRSGFSAEEMDLATAPVPLTGYTPQGMADPARAYVPPPTRARVVLLNRREETAQRWRAALAEECHNHRIESHLIGDMQGLFQGRDGPDAVVVELAAEGDDAGLGLLADLRARGATRDIAVIAAPEPGTPRLAAEALDRGAHDVLSNGFDATELGLKLDAQLRRKERSDRIRATLRNELRAAVQDSMTGLYNRRYAMPRLAEIARTAAEQGTGFAVMLADLDHFKRINDEWGHPVGDAVLIEAARRLRTALAPGDLIARMGGEEFLIALPRCRPHEATELADRLCAAIQSTPFRAAGAAAPIDMTVSIGVALGGVQEGRRILIPPCHQGQDPALALSRLIRRADRALYTAKRGGRNQVTLAHSAAA